MTARWLPSLVLACLFGVSAQAHRLSVHWEAEGNRLTVTGSIEGGPAAGADVEFLSAAGEVVAAGVLDAQGHFSATVPGTGDLTVNVSAGLGHRRSVVIRADELQANRPAAVAREGPSTNNAPGPTRSAGGDGGFSTPARVVLGLTFVLAAAAAWMSYRNSRRLSALENRSQPDAR